MRYFWINGWVLLALCQANLIAAVEPAVPEHAKALMGCWQNTTDNTIYINFTPRKVSWLQYGGVQFGLAKYETGKVTIVMNGKRTVWGVEIKGDTLQVTLNGKPSEFKKLTELPREMKIEAASLAEAKEIPADKLKEIKDELAKRYALAESVKTEPEHYSNVASDNGWWMKKTIKEVGWIDAARFGKQTATEAFRLVHASADLPLMLAALPGLEKDAKAKQIDAQQYAILYDKIQLHIGEKQLYGTQIGRDKGEMIMLPIEPIDKVNEARKALGLVSFNDYVETFEKKDGKKLRVLE